MNVRICWVREMECMCAQTRPRFILSSETVFGGMEFEPMLTPREKSSIPANFPRGGSNPRRCGQRAQTLPTSYSGPGILVWRPAFDPHAIQRSSPEDLVGLVVKAPSSRAEGPGFESRLRRDFSASSHTSDLKIGSGYPARRLAL